MTVSTALRADKKIGRMPALDVIRGGAVALVLLRHAWPDTFSGAGLVGVVLFFVLSGYLITGVLARDIERHGRVRYGVFYAHRAFRLLPALTLFVLTYATVELVTDILGDRSAGTVWQSVAVAFLYIKDLPLPFEVSSAIGPLWTLAVEEQFYLVWPAVLVWAIARRRVGRVLSFSVVGIYLCMVVSVVGVSVARPDKLNQVYPLPTTWGYALVAGAAIYFYRDKLRSLLAGSSRIVAGSLAGVALVSVSLFAEVQFSTVFYLVGGPIVVVASAVLVHLASTARSVPAWTAPLRKLGMISYAAYLWNYMIVHWLQPVEGSALSPASAFLSIVCTIAAALISWYTVEALGRAWRKSFDQRHALRRSSISS